MYLKSITYYSDLQKLRNEVIRTSIVLQNYRTKKLFQV